MAISVVGFSTATGDGPLTVPGGQPGDIALLFFYRGTSSNAVPAETSNWVRFSAGSNGATYAACWLHYVDYTGDVTDDLYWASTTPPSSLMLVVFRGASIRGDFLRLGGTTQNVTFGLLDEMTPPSWVVCFVGHASSVPDLTGAVADLSLVVDGYRSACHAGPRSDWSELTVNFGGSTSLRWSSITIELVDAGGGPEPDRRRSPLLLIPR